MYQARILKILKMKKKIAQAKSEIYLGLNKNGIAIINSDNIWKQFLITEAKKGKCKDPFVQVKRILTQE